MTLNKKYSSFNQLKGLLWREWFDGILDGDFLPPVGGVIDLTDACNASCSHCNAQSFRSGNTLSTEHVKKVIDILADWGVKSMCYAGGGEPTLHPDFAEILEYTYDKGLELEISTNGTNLDKEKINAIANYGKFCGVSIDAGKRETWEELKGLDLWEKMIADTTELATKARKTGLDFTYKYMIVPDNQYELVDACRKAKVMGFQNFFVRPAALKHVPGVDMKDTDFDEDAIMKQYDECLTYEDDSFKVYGAFGRVKGDMTPKLKFDKCRATPLVALFCADGYCYTCISKREQKEYRMCKHLDIKDYWNSKEHKELIDSIDKDKCPLCPWSHYNEQIEAYKEDYMFKWFP